MIRNLFLASIFFITLQAGAVYAACYSAAEAEAEQGLRIHSELMVIGLNCQHMTPAGWKNFYQEYREITARNQDLFREYENTMSAYYTRQGKNPDRSIRTMKTDFANRISTNAAQMRPDIFCATYAPRIPEVAKMNREQLRQWASSASNGQSQSQARCN